MNSSLRQSVRWVTTIDGSVSKGTSISEDSPATKDKLAQPPVAEITTMLQPLLSSVVVEPPIKVIDSPRINDEHRLREGYVTSQEGKYPPLVAVAAKTDWGKVGPPPLLLESSNSAQE
ncbi:unnamed protein product [Linum trigynum]|uniref:Uncharacterized protein n=1 Tax=Linum trigynum TaxID=586398 RepID=A0AAV2CUU5_9ROSI